MLHSLHFGLELNCFLVSPCPSDIPLLWGLLSGGRAYFRSCCCPNYPPTSSIHFLSPGLSSNATPTLHPTIYFQYLKDRVENNISFVSISVMKPTAQSGETKEKPAVHYFRGRCEFDCFHTGIRAQNTVRDRVVMKSFAGGMHRQTALKIMSQGTSDEGTGCLLPGCFSRHAHLNNLPCWACAVLPGESRGTGGFQKGRCCFFFQQYSAIIPEGKEEGLVSATFFFQVRFLRIVFSLRDSII